MSPRYVTSEPHGKQAPSGRFWPALAVADEGDDDESAFDPLEDDLEWERMHEDEQED